MSGGSYDYLYAKEAEEIIGGDQDQTVYRMMERLSELGYEDAAQETFTVMLAARAARIRMDALMVRLGPVWRAVEWLDSGDSELDAVDKAVKRYRGEETSQ